MTLAAAAIVAFFAPQLVRARILGDKPDLQSNEHDVLKISDHHLSVGRDLSTCSAHQEESFSYAASIEVIVYGGNPMCSDNELEALGEELTETWGDVATLDPRLAQVTELSTELCSVLPDESRRRDRFRNRDLAYFQSNGGFTYNWSGEGRCRYCPTRNSDADHGRKMVRSPSFLEYPIANEAPLDLGEVVDSPKNPTSRELQAPPECTGFILHRKKTFARELKNADIIDIQIYGEGVTVVAECSDNTKSVDFQLNGEPYHVENKEPFPLNGDGWDRFGRKYNPVPEFQNPGTYVVTATPYSERYKGGVPGQPKVLALLIMNGGTNKGSGLDSFVQLLEDDLGFYLSYKMNDLYYGKKGHCFEHNLIWVKVDLDVVNPNVDVCALDQFRA